MCIHHLLITFLVMTLSPSFAKPNCDRICKGNNNHKTVVPYPFGFSNGCKIRLECTNTGQIRIAKHRVLNNITSDHILVHFPANCTRPFEEIRRLRSENYAITSRNELMLGNCSHDTLNKCSLSTTWFKLPTCESMDNASIISCYSMDDGNDHAKFMNIARLEMAGCRVLYSSIVVESDEESMLVALELQALELGWWVQGNCSCHHKAVCINVSINDVRVGHRCNCVDGYDGDGFVDGKGCRKEIQKEDNVSNGADWGLIISIVFGSAIGFWLIVAPLIVNRAWRNIYFRFLSELGYMVYDVMSKCRVNMSSK